MEAPVEKRHTEVEAEAVRVELSYCSRCGTLWVHPSGDGGRVCRRCERLLAWLTGGRQP